MRIVFTLLFLVILIVGCTKYEPLTILSDDRETYVRVEIADEPHEHQKGLMHRVSMGDYEGMLFIFPDIKVRTFWMKNTYIPLDIIYINEDLEIITIRKAVPCESDPCPIYQSSAPAKYVLELNAGFTEEHSIIVGDTIVYG